MSRNGAKTADVTQKATNLSLDRAVVRDAMVECLKIERTLSSVVEELLVWWVKRQQAAASKAGRS